MKENFVQLRLKKLKNIHNSLVRNQKTPCNIL